MPTRLTVPPRLFEREPKRRSRVTFADETPLFVYSKSTDTSPEITIVPPTSVENEETVPYEMATNILEDYIDDLVRHVSTDPSTIRASIKRDVHAFIAAPSTAVDLDRLRDKLSRACILAGVKTGDKCTVLQLLDKLNNES